MLGLLWKNQAWKEGHCRKSQTENQTRIKNRKEKEGEQWGESSFRTRGTIAVYSKVYAVSVWYDPVAGGGIYTNWYWIHCLWQQIRVGGHKPAFISSYWVGSLQYAMTYISSCFSKGFAYIFIPLCGTLNPPIFSEMRQSTQTSAWLQSQATAQHCECSLAVLISGSTSQRGCDV